MSEVIKTTSNGREYLWNGSNHINIKFIEERASVQEVIEFANTVREAGGGNIISELMPSDPNEPDSCLIANALNFNCSIRPDEDVVEVEDLWSYENEYEEGGADLLYHSEWCMFVENEELAQKISNAIGTKYVVAPVIESYGVVLPDEIAYVAIAFDSMIDVELNKFIDENSPCTYLFL